MADAAPHVQSTGRLHTQAAQPRWKQRANPPGLWPDTCRWLSCLSAANSSPLLHTKPGEQVAPLLFLKPSRDPPLGASPARTAHGRRFGLDSKSKRGQGPVHTRLNFRTGPWPYGDTHAGVARQHPDLARNQKGEKPRALGTDSCHRSPSSWML